jgi:type I restriction enzyme S subunit
VWATVEQLASTTPRSIQSGPFGSSLLHSEFQTEGKLVIGIDNVQDGFFSLGAQNRISDAKFDMLAKYEARPLDLAITVMATIGRCCIVPPDVEKAIFSKHVYRVSLDQQLVSPPYVVVALRSPLGREKMLMESKGQTRPGLNGEIIKGLPIPLPPLAEQRRIVAEVDRRLSVLNALETTVDTNLARCARLRQAILKRAFEGRLVPPEAPAYEDAEAPTGA